VWVIAEEGLNSLLSFRNQCHFRAGNGSAGGWCLHFLHLHLVYSAVSSCCKPPSQSCLLSVAVLGFSKQFGGWRRYQQQARCVRMALSAGGRVCTRCRMHHEGEGSADSSKRARAPALSKQLCTPGCRQPHGTNSSLGCCCMGLLQAKAHSVMVVTALTTTSRCQWAPSYGARTQA
jgi:hypothetical protein